MFELFSDITTLDIHQLFVKEDLIESIEIFKNFKSF